MATSSKTSRSEQPANKLETIHKALHDFLHQKSAVTPVFELVEKHAKLKREYLFLGGWRSRPATCNQGLWVRDVGGGHSYQTCRLWSAGGVLFTCVYAVKS